MLEVKEQGIEHCKSCNAEHKMSIRFLPARDSDSVHCQACGEVMKSWKNQTSTWIAELVSNPS